MRERWLWLPVALLPALTLAPLAALRFVDVDEGTTRPQRRSCWTASPVPRLPLHADAAAALRLRRVGRGARRALARHPLAVARARARYGAAADAASFVRFGLRLALLGSVLFATSTLVFTWYPPVKTFALSTAARFRRSCYRARQSEGRARGLPCGRPRLTRRADARAVRRRALAFAWEASGTGAAFAAISLGFASRSAQARALRARPARFPIRRPLGCTACAARAGSSATSSRRRSRRRPARDRDRLKARHPVPPLGGAAVVAAVVARSERGRLPLWFIVAALLALLALFPTPTYTQYFATTIPFLIVGVVELVRAALRVTCCSVPLPWCGSSRTSYSPPSSWFASSARRRKPPARMQEVADFVDARTRARRRGARLVAGYLFGTHATPVHGLENDFGPHDAEPLTPSRRGATT